MERVFRDLERFLRLPPSRGDARRFAEDPFANIARDFTYTSAGLDEATATIISLDDPVEMAATDVRGTLRNLVTPLR